MTLLSRLGSYLDRLTTAREYGDLLALSDRELQARGYDRDRLIRAFISGNGV